MFAPLYRAATRQGIAGAELDASPLHVVRWMLEDEPEPGRPDPRTEAAVRAQRVAAARGEAAPPAYEPFDPSVLGG